MNVIHSLKRLLEYVPADVFREAVSIYMIEEVATSEQLLHDVADLSLMAIDVIHRCIVLEAIVRYDMWMVQHSSMLSLSFQFCLEETLHGLAREDFDGKLLTILSCPEPNLRLTAYSKAIS